MSKLLSFFEDGQAEGDSKRRDLLGGKGAGLAEGAARPFDVPTRLVPKRARVESES
jgi:hypothetical protein